MPRLPRPTAVFDQSVSIQQRRDVYNEYINWINGRTMLVSRRDVLAKVMEYANKNLIHYKGWVLTTDVARFKTFNEIMEKADVLNNELLFQQFVINKMREIQDGTSSLKKAVLPLAEEYRERLWGEVCDEVYPAACALLVMGSGALFLSKGFIGMGIIGLSFAGTLFAKQVAEWRINRALEKRLALIAARQPDLGDDFNDVIRKTANAAKTVRSWLGLFTAEEKQSESGVSASARNLSGMQPGN